MWELFLFMFLSDENGDPESGPGTGTSMVDKGPPTSVVVPIYRRDCHQEVYAGSHQARSKTIKKQKQRGWTRKGNSECIGSAILRP